MKIISVFIIFFLAISVKCTIFEIQENQCLSELKLNPEIISVIDKQLNVTFPNDDYGKLKACVYTKKGFLTHRGRILWGAAQTAIIEALKEKSETTKNYNHKTIVSEIQNIIKACKNQNFVSDKVGDVAINIRNCLLSFDSSRSVYFSSNSDTSKSPIIISTTERGTTSSELLPSISSEASAQPLPEVSPELTSSSAVPSSPVAPSSEVPPLFAST